MPRRTWPLAFIIVLTGAIRSPAQKQVQAPGPDASLRSEFKRPQVLAPEKPALVHLRLFVALALQRGL
jgi:hypothetical protein